MVEYMPYIWAVVTVIAIITETIIADLVTIWFIPAGILSLILSLLPIKIPVYLQVAIFFAVSIGLVVMSKTIFKELFKKKPLVRTNLDAVIGKDAVVIETINNLEGKGAVKVGGKVWSAVSEDDSIIKENELVIVKEIRGVKLICIKK